jgi:hypothetical protein
MSDEILEYVGIDYIKNDLKRLRKWSSLEQDIYNNYRILMGKLTDGLSPSIFSCPLGDFITEKKIENITIHFYKIKVGISSPKLFPNNGARLIHGVIRGQRKFIPILVYGAFEERKYYSVNNKKFPLKRKGLIGIIDEKLKSI